MSSVCGSRDGLLFRCRMADKELKISLKVVDATTTTFSQAGTITYFQPDADQRPWHIIAYEVWMYFGTRAKMKAPTIDDEVLRNATVESAIVHARILCDIFLSRATRQSGGILLTALSREWKRSNPQQYKDLRSRVKDLIKAYGDHGVERSPCQIFHQKALHADEARYQSFQGYDYADQFKALDSAIRGVVDAIEAIRGKLPTPF